MFNTTPFLEYSCTGQGQLGPNPGSMAENEQSEELHLGIYYLYQVPI